ncbi:COX assembly mitochondrial protein homolog isoform X3 [Lepisosteus oculatus]|uniref:COX assembly mitochondrial protein homolog isoform X3 n=1 Tax=Lepisosteus oculatus TaxID=7918 RepID=UPI0035F51669
MESAKTGEPSLRHVEKDVLIPKMMREKAKEYCSEKVDAIQKMNLKQGLCPTSLGQVVPVRPPFCAVPPSFAPTTLPPSPITAGEEPSGLDFPRRGGCAT